MNNNIFFPGRAFCLRIGVREKDVQKNNITPRRQVYYMSSHFIFSFPSICFTYYYCYRSIYKFRPNTLLAIRVTAM